MATVWVLKMCLKSSGLASLEYSGYICGIVRSSLTSILHGKYSSFSGPIRGSRVVEGVFAYCLLRFPYASRVLVEARSAGINALSPSVMIYFVLRATRLSVVKAFAACEGILSIKQWL